MKRKRRQISISGFENRNELCFECCRTRTRLLRSTSASLNPRQPSLQPSLFAFFTFLFLLFLNQTNKISPASLVMYSSENKIISSFLIWKSREENIAIHLLSRIREYYEYPRRRKLVIYAYWPGLNWKGKRDEEGTRRGRGKGEQGEKVRTR